MLEIGLALLLIAFAVAVADKPGLSNVPFLILMSLSRAHDHPAPSLNV
jgi:hypothetical protein